MSRNNLFLFIATTYYKRSSIFLNPLSLSTLDCIATTTIVLRLHDRGLGDCPPDPSQERKQIERRRTQRNTYFASYSRIPCSLFFPPVTLVLPLYSFIFFTFSFLRIKLFWMKGERELRSMEKSFFGMRQPYKFAGFWQPSMSSRFLLRSFAIISTLLHLGFFCFVISFHSYAELYLVQFFFYQIPLFALLLLT